MLRDLITSLALQPHPEGGWYRETYRSTQLVDVKGVLRPASTAIYFLLGARNISRLHRIVADEVWHFYAGADLEVVSFHEDGRLVRDRIGSDAQTGAMPQCVVPAGRWFGARLAEPHDDSAYALVGCTVAPAFDFADLELGERARLLQLFPNHSDVVTALTHAS